MAGQMREDVGPPRPDDRADQRAAARRQHREPAGAAASQQAHHHRLGPVIGVVRRGDQRAPGGSRRALQRVEAGPARPGLQVSAGFDPHARPIKAEVRGPGPSLRQVELGSGLGAQPVIDSVGDQLNP